MKKRKHLSALFYEMGNEYIYLAGMGEALATAEKEGVEEIVVTKSQFEQVKRYMAMSAIWNWDKKTFWGMTFVIEE
jgi:hypothetical protein